MKSVQNPDLTTEVPDELQETLKGSGRPNSSALTGVPLVLTNLGIIPHRVAEVAREPVQSRQRART